MKHNTLAATIIASAALAVGALPEAQAVHLDPGGIGEVLVFPYYTVNAGNQTLLSVVNKTDQGKAVKLRFREGYNARSVSELNLYLAAYDVWTASVFSLSDSGSGSPANLMTTDNTCTVPGIKGNPDLPVLPNGMRYLPFSNYNYTGDNDEAGPDTLDRTREGHFELIEMGVVTNWFQDSLDAISHNESGIPADCMQVVRAWEPLGSVPLGYNYWSVNPLVDMDPPTGGLYGAASIINTTKGTMLRYDAEAIAAFSNLVSHSAPAAAHPTLASAHEASVDNTITAKVFRDGVVVASRYPEERAIDAVTALLMQDQVFGEFATGPALVLSSEWILTFPTKYAYTDEAIVGATAVPPFTRVFPTTAPGGLPNPAVGVELSIFDREEGTGTSPCVDPDSCVPIFPPPPPPMPFPNPVLKWSSNVLTFNQPNSGSSGSTILGSRLSNSVRADVVDISDGWAHLNFQRASAPAASHYMRADLDGVIWAGLPVVGFRATQYGATEVMPGVFSINAELSRLRAVQRVQGELSVPVESKRATAE